jgi:outer membrane immunogenic protein
LGLNHRFGATTGTGSSTSAAEPSSDWNGFYIGANAGRGIGRSPTNLSSTVLGDPFGNDTWQQGAEGYLGGLLAGMNWQASQWVFGIEADLQVSRMKDAACVFFCNDRLPSEVVEQKIPWFATVRGRLGYSTGPTLLYVTGGWAYGKMDTTISSTVTPIGARPGLPVVFGFSDMGSGWTIGGGADAALWGNWSARTEYLYVDLGSISNSFANNRVGPPAIDHVFRQDVRFHVFRGALTYRFASLLAAPY